jgi:hypothetical protein
VSAVLAAGSGLSLTVPLLAITLLGIVAAACGLAVAELLTGVWTSVQSPVLSVGDRVVDADTFVTGNLKLVWASRETSPQWADSMGCVDIFINKLLAYWEERLKHVKDRT